MEEFVTNQLELLSEEHEAEITENMSGNSGVPLQILKRKGFCLSKLRIAELKTGLYGRTVATFSLKAADNVIPSNTFSSGDIVQIRQPVNQSISATNGVVLSVTIKQLVIAFDGNEIRDTLDVLLSKDNSITLVKVASEVTYRRLKHAMEDLKKVSDGPSQHLVDVLFGVTDVNSTNISEELDFFNPNLNHSQQEAVKLALCQNELAIVHGPPGTGKTTTVVEIIAQLVNKGKKILACAPSNIAVDNLVDKLLDLKVFKTGNKKKLKVVRIGHPARIKKQQLYNVSLDALVSHCDAAAIVRDVRLDIEAVHSKLRKRPDKGTVQRLRRDRKELYAELAHREKQVLHEILTSADVVLSTNVGAHPKGPLKHIKEDHFDVVVIDECGQALEASCWIPLLNKRKCVLSGDHLQLPPTIISKKAANKGLSVTLLERLCKLHPKSVVMLVEQYRMHKTIMEWASCQMYDGKLIASKSVATHLLSDMPNVTSNEDTSCPMLLIDTAGCDMVECESELSDSKANKGEARIVHQHVTNLVEAGVSPDKVAVISPYRLQVEILRKMLHPKYSAIEIQSVDGFQGREKEAIVLSLVRSNDKREIGFLADNRRLNVAITRARRHLAVVCDTATVKNHGFVKSLIDYITQQGEVKTGFEYSDEDVVNVDTQCFAGLLVSKSKTSNNKVPDEEASLSEKPPPVNRKTHTNTIEDLKRGYFNALKQFQLLGNNVSDLNLSIEGSLSALNASYHEGQILFATKLNSAERKAIHEICEELALNHTSVGTGHFRRVIVSNPKITNLSNVASLERLEPETNTTEVETSAESCSVNSVKSEPTECKSNVYDGDDFPEKHDSLPNFPIKLSEQATDNMESSVSYVVCETCGKRLPQANLDLHLMHCARVMKMKEVMSCSTKENSPKNPQITKKKRDIGRKSKQKLVKTNKDDDDDILLADAIASNRICCHKNCAAKVTTTGQLCSVCKKNFCLEHCIPEVHGCGGGIRLQTRKKISKGVLYNGGGLPDQKLSADKRAALRGKLSKKVKSMEDDRKCAHKANTK